MQTGWRRHCARIVTVADYYQSVLGPVLASNTDDGELAVWLNRQADEWELDVDRADGSAIAGEIVKTLLLELEKLKERVRRRIAAAEREIGHLRLLADGGVL